MLNDELENASVVQKSVIHLNNSYPLFLESF
jgi:hypothetical protein